MFLDKSLTLAPWRQEWRCGPRFPCASQHKLRTFWGFAKFPFFHRQLNSLASNHSLAFDIFSQ